jgi:hypothetical protein
MVGQGGSEEGEGLLCVVEREELGPGHVFGGFGKVEGEEREEGGVAERSTG